MCIIDRSYKDAKFNRYLELFKEIMDGAEHCNNVSTLRSYADKAESLKLRLLNEMNPEDIRLMQEAAAKAEAERKRQEEEAKKRGETVKPCLLYTSDVYKRQHYAQKGELMVPSV